MAAEQDFVTCRMEGDGACVTDVHTVHTYRHIHVRLCRSTLGMPDGRLITVAEEEVNRSAQGR